MDESADTTTATSYTTTEPADEYNDEDYYNDLYESYEDDYDPSDSSNSESSTYRTDFDRSTTETNDRYDENPYTRLGHRFSHCQNGSILDYGNIGDPLNEAINDHRRAHKKI